MTCQINVSKIFRFSKEKILKEKILIVYFLQYEINMGSKSVKIA